MFEKISLQLSIFLIILNFNFANAHVSHYQNLNKLVFDLYRNNQHIGQHIYVFIRDGNNLKVKNTINFEIKKFGVTFYKYFAEGEEEYIDDKLESFSSTTKQNKKEKFVKIYKKDNKFFIEGTSYKGDAPEDFTLGTWWNHSIVKSKAQISAASGRIIEQNVKFLGKENIEIKNEQYSALKFNFTSSDPKLSKGKKLDTNVWYDEKNLIWIKAGFKNKGNWEYRLSHIE